ncbi:ferritin-like superfamily [Gorgonomyces haynaldii]|nr:ferritin-like superfamily [Gorgonomyces haynaldii]
MPEQEPILIPNSKRFVLFPIKYHEIWQHYKTVESKFWAAEDVEFSDDMQGFEKLTGREQMLLLHLVACLIMNDSTLGASVVQKISTDIQSPEARCFYGFQIMQRNIHLEMLVFGLDLLRNEGMTREDLFQSGQKLTFMSQKTAWVQQHLTDSAHDFSMRIVSLAIYNKVMQNAIYDVLLHVQELPGLVHGICKIRQDHDYYFTSSLIVQKLLVNKPDVRKVHDMVKKCVAIEHQAIEDIYELCGKTLRLSRPINKEDLKTRVMAIADDALVELGYPRLFDKKDPLPWISELVSAELKKHEAPEQAKAAPVYQAKKMDTAAVFSTDEDF